MDQLLDSRINKPEQQMKFESVSPDRFGKGGYAGLTYTPSKLASNILYKQVISMRRVQQGSSKVRQSQAINNFLKDKLRHMQQQRDGIENSLTQQIAMYKKMLHEMENTHQERIKYLQTLFNEQIQRIISEKEEEAKYVQSEKQLLENRIYQLEAFISALKDEMNIRGGELDTLTKQHEKLQIDYRHMKEKNQQLAIKMKTDEKKALKSAAELKDKIERNVVQFRRQLEKAQQDADKDRQNAFKLHISEKEMMQSQQEHQIMKKNQEIKDITHNFENQIRTLNKTIIDLHQKVDSLDNTLSDERQKANQLFQKLKSEISMLNSDKNKLHQEVASQSEQITKRKTQINKMEQDSTQTSSNYEATIAKLKEDLQFTQINYIREKEKHDYDVQDLHTEVLILRKNIEQNKIIMDEKAMLCRQIINLKDLLMESSMELQRCKDEFVRLAKDKDHLIIKLRELDVENEALHRVKVEREEEAKGWRDTYYMSRR